MTRGLLITPRLTEAHRMGGRCADADSRLLKRPFDQSELLATVARLRR